MKNLTLTDETSKSPRLQLTGSNPPKKAFTAFLIFSNEKRPAVMKEN